MTISYGPYPSASPPVFLVCCHCKRKVTTHRYWVNGHPVETHHCPEHGDVAAMRSAVVNHQPAPHVQPDWSAA